MHTVTMEKQCGCFKKSDFSSEQTFSTQEEALSTASEMCNKMNTSFCAKHDFTVEHVGNEIVIRVSNS